MSGMARHGSVGAFSGFSVCQPALGAALQWLPAIGTAELDDMINAFLPGPASIQDKRAHISMDFFEFSRQTGENFKFYPVSSGSLTPLTASPSTSALYDSNYSPVLSDQASWTQSPAPFAAAASDARTKSRSSVSKKSSTGTVDFATHPGMRILTKDGRDVTNSASRGCKTKEQRDHAHLMRIIKACDACRKKKIRCDPSHRKRTAPQASSASQAEQKPAKKPRMAAEPPPVVVAESTNDIMVLDALDETALSFPGAEGVYIHQDVDELWNDFITFDQEPLAVTTAPTFDDFLFDSFTDPQNYSPTSGSSSTSPSQTFTPFTAARASPLTAPDLALDAAAEFSLQDPTVPYLNPGVAHGTNYVDFNLYSPGPEVFDEDPVLQMRDLGSRQHSPQSLGFVQDSPRPETEQGVGVTVPRATSASDLHGGARHTVTASPDHLSWYYDPGPSLDGLQSTGIGSTTSRRVISNHSRLVEGGAGAVRSPGDGQLTNHMRQLDGDGLNTAGLAHSSVSRPSLASLGGSPRGDATCTVVADVLEPSVSPSPSPRPGRPLFAPAGVLATPLVAPAPSTSTLRSGVLPPQAAATATATAGLSPAVGQPHKAARVTALVSGQLLVQQGLTDLRWNSVLSTLAAKSAPSVPVDGQRASAPRNTVAVNVVRLTTTTVSPATLPTRCNVAVGEGEDMALALFFFLLQLAVFGLVSLLCASAALRPATHLASQVIRLLANANNNNNYNNVLAVACISLLARLTPSSSLRRWCDAGPSSKTLRPLPSSSVSPTTTGAARTAATVSAPGRSAVLQDVRCAVRRRVGNLVPAARLLSV